MKALTLHQPWASLVAVGAKKIETRSWSTSYRGPLAIHAAKRPVRDVPHERTVGEYRVRMVGRTGARLEGPGIEPFDHQTGHGGLSLPLGAVVASATLIDCVPIADPDDAITPGLAFMHADSDRSHAWVQQDGVTWISPREEPFGLFWSDHQRFAWLLDDVARVEDRCPWCRGRGVLTEPERDPLHTGRKVKVDCPVCSGAGKCDPVPATGRERLWWWRP